MSKNKKTKLGLEDLYQAVRAKGLEPELKERGQEHAFPHLVNTCKAIWGDDTQDTLEKIQALTQAAKSRKTLFDAHQELEDFVNTYREDEERYSTFRMKILKKLYKEVTGRDVVGDNVSGDFGDRKFNDFRHVMSFGSNYDASDFTKYKMQLAEMEEQNFGNSNTGLKFE